MEEKPLPQTKMPALMSVAPQTEVIAETGEVVIVDEIKLNTVVAAKAREVIPIDDAIVDETKFDRRVIPCFQT